MMTNRIHNIKTLKEEKNRLKLELEQTEQGLGSSFSYFKKNKGKIMWSVVNPVSQYSTLGTVLEGISTAVGPLIESATGIRVYENNGKLNQTSLKAAIIYVAVSTTQKWLEKRKARKAQQQQSEVPMNDEVQPIEE
jgi:hypothetical protein